MTAALRLDDVHAGYGPFRALFGVSLSIAEGEAVALLGANGAGKTTVARLACGLIKPVDGSVFVGETDMSRARTFEFAKAGVAHAPEGRSVFASLSVEENLVLSFRQSRGASGVRGALEEAFDLFPNLGDRRTQLAGTLSGGEQRMLSMSRVLVERPKLLIADELSLGLAPIIVDEIYKLLVKIREAGTSLLIVEQHVTHALNLSDRVILLDHGRVAWEGPSDEAEDVVVNQLFDTGQT